MAAACVLAQDNPPFAPAPPLFIDLCKGVDCAGSVPACQESPGSCDPRTGVCDYLPFADGAPCDDADPATQDQCVSGKCIGTAPTVQPPPVAPPSSPLPPPTSPPVKVPTVPVTPPVTPPVAVPAIPAIPLSNCRPPDTATTQPALEWSLAGNTLDLAGTFSNPQLGQWVAVGLSPTGGTAMSDIDGLVAYVTESGKVCISDFHASVMGFPSDPAVLPFTNRKYDGTAQSLSFSVGVAQLGLADPSCGGFQVAFARGQLPAGTADCSGVLTQHDERGRIAISTFCGLMEPCSSSPISTHPQPLPIAPTAVSTSPIPPPTPPPQAVPLAPLPVATPPVRPPMTLGPCAAVDCSVVLELASVCFLPSPTACHVLEAAVQ
eukprot:gene3193-3717_t